MTTTHKAARWFLVLLLAALYGWTVSQLPNEGFKDFTNYLVYANNSWNILEGRTQKGLFSMLANEPLWLILNSFLASFLSPENTVRALIFLSGFTVSATLLHNSRVEQIHWVLLFLLLPAVIKNHLIHIRQGVAIALFLYGWFSSSRPLKWILLSLTPFIHASFFFVLAILAFSNLFVYFRLAYDVRLLLLACLGLLVSLALGGIAELLGARQATEYQFTTASVSGLGFILWSLLLGIYSLEGKAYLRSHTFEIGMIAFYLATYWLIEVTARIFESGLLLVLIAGLSLTGWRRKAFLFLVLASSGLTWLVRLETPFWGFGIH